MIIDEVPKLSNSSSTSMIKATFYGRNRLEVPYYDKAIFYGKKNLAWKVLDMP